MTNASEAYFRLKQKVRKDAASRLYDLGYNPHMIDGLDLYVFENEAQFCRRSETKPNGLSNDRDTMPVPVMLYDLKTREVKFYN